MAISKIQTKRTLLWTNSNPSVNFNPVDISMDLKDYKEIEVYAYLYVGFRHFVPIVKIPIGSQGNITGVAGNAGETQGVLVAVIRGISCSTDSIHFYEGKGCTVGGNWATNNGNAIPVKIYGIK